MVSGKSSPLASDSAPLAQTLVITAETFMKMWVKALYYLDLHASSPAQGLCICLTGLGVASRLAW